MKILQTMVAINGDSEMEGKLFQIDTIEHDGKKWLVPEWLTSPAEGWSTPARIICLDCLRYQKAPAAFSVDYVLNEPLPKAVYDGKAQLGPTRAYVVVERPDLKIRIGSKLN